MEFFSEQSVAAQARLMRVGDGVDDDLADFEIAGHGAETVSDVAGRADKVARPFAFLGLVQAARGERQERVGRSRHGGQFTESVVGRGDGTAVVHANATLQQTDRGGEVLSFFFGRCANYADGDRGFRARAVRAGLEVGAVVLDGRTR